ncbi:MAG: DNA polymerase III subunit gamma/tau [Rhodanobacteraceae bacterium]
MSYQALARKWRPRRFSELVGQEHVVRALSHALDGNRIHHAFLFTGTRGIGKTTIARIFAKSLNCERGPTSTPCGECGPCTEIDAGRFMDLLEIDAASNTGIDNVRDLIDNAQYAPTRGRYKVYLIDEVHMLSKSAFNALLKTLEEPPPHVKFLLATTDPQKLPVTVLSRCIKFNLKRLTPDQIAGQMRSILIAESVSHDEEALETLARAADGSLRDGLSLLDQAIAHGDGALDAASVHAMLGTVERGKVRLLLDALAAGDGAGLLGEIDRIAEFAPDFSQVLDELAGLLHRLQLLQLVAAATSEEDAVLLALAGRLDPADVQLWYQFAITGRRDLPLAPTPRVGFEMALLRMLAFVPAVESEPRMASPAGKPGQTGNADESPNIASSPPVRNGQRETSSAPAHVSRPTPKSSSAPEPETAVARDPVDDDWPGLIERAQLRGATGQLAQNVALIAIEGGVVRLGLKAAHEHLAADPLVEQLEQGIGDVLGRNIRVRFERAGAAVETPADKRDRAACARRAAAEAALRKDPVVQSLIDTFDARVLPESVRPIDP